jgi:hypothetical protein
MKLISRSGSNAKKQSNKNKSMPDELTRSEEVSDFVQGFDLSGLSKNYLQDIDHNEAPQSNLQDIRQNEAPQSDPQDIKQSEAPQSNLQNLVRQDAAEEPALQEAPPKNPQPKARKKPKYVYPEATLSEKQMAELKKIVRPSAQRGAALQDSKQITMAEPIGIEIKDRSIAKTVVFIVVLIGILSAAGFAGWYYWWTTHATFEYTLQPVVILDGQSVAPNDFLYPGEEMAGVTAVFRDPDFVPAVGLHFVPLTLTLNLRTVDTAAILYVLTPIEFLQHELSVEGVILRPVEFLSNADITTNVSFNIRFSEEPQPLEEYPVGTFPLHLSLNDVPFEVMLHVIDTTPPTAMPVNRTIQIGEEVFPEEFVTDIYDASPIASVAFLNEPDIFARQDTIVSVVIEDIFGNGAVFHAELFVMLNQTPPVIEGVPGIIESEAGTPVTYDPGATAYDDFGRELEVYIDNSGVDEETVGTYIAVYWAEDLTGLRTEVEVTVHVISVDPDYVIQQVDELLSRVINDRMTQAQKTLAIHNWVRWTVANTTTGSGSRSVTEEAYMAIRERRGDSHVYASISELMLTRAGIPNMRIERTHDAETNHYWLLVNPDGLGWHHFDPFPTGISLSDRTSMFTDSQAKEFAQRIQAHSGVEDYFAYDAGLYPDIVQE